MKSPSDTQPAATAPRLEVSLAFAGQMRFFRSTALLSFLNDQPSEEACQESLSDQESETPAGTPPTMAEPTESVITMDGSKPYKVELDIFEGPMDLLLYLIKKDEVDVYDISIERITQQYMKYLDTFQMLSIALAGEFLVMAANLCYIKSRLMLPKHVQPPDEDVEEDDPRWDLIRQLVEYKKFKEAARKLGDREEKQSSLYTNHPEKIVALEQEERPLDESLGIFDLIRAFQNILDRFQEDEGLGEVVDDNFTVAEKIDFILDSVAPGTEISFSTLFAEAASKREMIVTFLAVLELMKINFVKVKQEKLLGEIVLQRNEMEAAAADQQNPLAGE